MPGKPHVLATTCVMLFAVLVRPTLAETSVYGELTLTSDYVFRGVSQTLSKPALQAEIGFEHSSGWHGFLWGSNVDFIDDTLPDDGAHTEINLGIARDLAIGERVSARLGWIGYLFPGTDPGVDYDYTEWLVTLALDGNHAITFGHSADVFGSGAAGQFYALDTGIAINQHLSLGVELGYYDLDRAYGASYSYLELGLAGKARQVDWRLSHIATDSRAAGLFIDSTVGQRLVFTLSVSF